MNLNLRDVPEELMRKLKADSAGQGITLREYCLAKLGHMESRKIVATAAVKAAAHPDWRKAKDKEHAKAVEDAAVAEKLIEDPTIQHYPPAFNYEKPGISSYGAYPRRMVNPKPKHDKKTCRVYKCGMCG